MASSHGRYTTNWTNRGFASTQKNFHADVPVKDVTRDEKLRKYSIDYLEKNIGAVLDQPKNQRYIHMNSKPISTSSKPVWSFRKEASSPPKMYGEQIANVVKKEKSTELFGVKSKIVESSNIVEPRKTVCEGLVQNEISKSRKEVPATVGFSDDCMIINSSSHVELEIPRPALMLRPFGGGGKFGSNMVPVEKLKAEDRKKLVEPDRFNSTHRRILPQPLSNSFARSNIGEPVQPWPLSSDSGFVDSERPRQTNVFGHSRPFEMERQEDDYSNVDVSKNKPKGFGSTKNNDCGLLSSQFGAAEETFPSTHTGITSKILDETFGTTNGPSIYNDYYFPETVTSGMEIRHTIEIILKEKPKLDEPDSGEITLERAYPMCSKSKMVPIIFPGDELSDEAQFSPECGDNLKIATSGIQISMKNAEQSNDNKLFSSYGDISKMKTDSRQSRKSDSSFGLMKEDIRELARISQMFHDVFAEMNEFVQRVCQR